ncbi:SGNH/GDSL hydrolase family protein [Candidatus Thiosymbion oneisti]|uniref:SGNH/GDSL hydrolase family protein n=1 Tax=Candidatus Thiosymbion oneisti TaxID=589554 RepID=UPI000A5C4BED|nr:SGNH/GDSL hydrolase family protein [Candidatus Thiosymbion oneisti]
MINAKHVWVILLLSVTTAIASYGAEESRLLANLRSGKKQVVVTYGTSLTAEGAWVTQLKKELDKTFPGLTQVLNSGGSSKWSEWGVKNLDKRVIQKKPDTVFIEFSINDAVERFKGSVEIAKANLETMIARILESNPNCEIILMTMTPGDKYPKGHRSYRKDIAAHYEMYRSVAEKKKLLLIDHYPTWKTLQSENKALFRKYVPDTIHPTALGCSEVVTPAILKALGMKSPNKPDARDGK